MTARRVLIGEHDPAAPRGRRRRHRLPRRPTRDLLDDAAGTITRPTSEEHIAVTLAAAGERDLLHEVTRRLTPWARDRVTRT